MWEGGQDTRGRGGGVRFDGALRTAIILQDDVSLLVLELAETQENDVALRNNGTRDHGGRA